tara:strand:+ start:561 stop:773 length:213 start_codon:yes stop_codon:yes gene_type:complete
MTDDEKVSFYNTNRNCIHPLIKSFPATKPLWRKLFWTTARDSDKYKIGCVDILESYFPEFLRELLKKDLN